MSFILSFKVSEFLIGSERTHNYKKLLITKTRVIISYIYNSWNTLYIMGNKT
jgi:hypothetical protein